MTSRQNSSDSDEIRQSLDVLDRILSEFDDIETDTNEDGAAPPVPSSEDGSSGPDPPAPPPIDRSLKPRDVVPAPPDLPRKTRSVPCPGSGSSSPSSHEYQEINSDVCRGESPPEAPELPELITSPTARSGRRQMSEERTTRHLEDEARRQPRRQRSEEGRSRRGDISSSSGDLGPPRARAPRDLSRGRGREGREQRHLRKSRSGDVEARRPQDPSRRRSRSSDRLLDHPAIPQHQLYHPAFYDPRLLDPSLMDPNMIDPAMMDPRLVDPRLVDPRLVDPRLVDPRLVDPRLLDPRYIDEPYPLVPQDPGLFPHLMRYPAVTQAGPLSPGSLSPVPPGPPMGPPFLPMEYPPYPMYAYDQGYMGDPTMVPDPALLPPHPPLPPHLPPDLVPHPYPPDYPLHYGPLPPHPALVAGMWGGPRPQPDWPPPSPEQARRTIHTIVRNPVRGGPLEEEVVDSPKKHLQAGRPGSRRLTSIGHSDSSGRSSPTEDRRGGRRWVAGGREAGSEFRVGEAVRGASPRGHMKSSTSLPHFSSGKDSGFEEAPVVGEDGHNTGGGRGGRAGGAFIVSGVFNDSSRMFIPAPPSPTPDYDDGEESDGNESDILQGSQFSPANDLSGDKRRVVPRDSLSDDSLHNAPVGPGRSSKPSTPVRNPPTPLQNMMKEFHQGLPPVDHENGFSDDSLEDSTAAPSRPSTMSQKPHRQTSLESLASMESSTASFDYMNAGQVKISAYEKPQSKPSPTTPGSGSNSMQKGSGHRDRKDANGKIKKSSSRTSENGFVSSTKMGNGSSRGDSESFNRQSSRDSSHSSGSNSSRPGEKFDSIQHMLKEGLIEGLDESPPQFKPPPPAKETLNGTQIDDRADSGLGSIFSTTRTDESGVSDLSNTPPSLTSPLDSSSTKKNRREKETVRSRSSIASEDIERNRDEGDEVEILMKETMEIPPPPPPRDESMHWTPKPPSQRDPTRHPARSVPSTPASSKNPSWLHTTGSGRDDALSLSSNQYSHSVDKITHVDDLYGQQDQVDSSSEVSSAINGSLASHYSAHDTDNPLTDREFLENLKNLEPRPRPDTLAVITEDQGSLGSRGSRSGRLLSRIADSVRSGSRTPTSSSSSAASTRATTTKLTSTSRSSTRIHGDIIREPWRSSVRESALPSPQEYSRLPSLSPSVIPLTRDGSGRFRSIEDIAEAAASPVPQGKKKKHSTLPPNLTPADVRKENKELRRATSLMVGKKGKDGSEGSKFRFNFFRGFWRRKQYSFDNKV